MLLFTCKNRRLNKCFILILYSNPIYLRESVYGMGAVLLVVCIVMYNLEKDNLKDIEVKAIQKDFNALKFKSAIVLYL